MKICVSDRCFFPRSAFTSSKTIVELAKSLGYEQVEFHPTWAVWWETLMRGKLSCQSEDVSSFHISWREDGRNMGLGFFKSLFNPDYRIFPPEILGTKVIQQLEKMYKKPVVVHWQEDFDRFKLPLLELHGPLGMNWQQIEVAIKRERIKGIVIDTGKFGGWLKLTGEKEDRVLPNLLPYIGEVHFRMGYVGGKEKESIRIMKKLVKMGYQGRVVSEMGWPDFGSIEVLHQEGLEKAHQRIVKFLKNL